MAINKLPEPILITGCARSGTSLVAGMINKSGAFGGNMSGPNRNNAKGMFENARIRNTLIKPYLKEIAVDPLGQYPLPDINKLPLLPSWRARVEQIMRDEGYQDGSWMYKGAKMCLTWKLWHNAFPNAKWVIVRRRTDDIVNSCQRTGFMRAFRNSHNQRRVGAKNEIEGWTWWVNQHLARFTEMADAGLSVREVWPERMVGGDYSEMQETIEWLGLEWNSEAQSFVDSKLWKAKRKIMPGEVK
jgi:hypothetical protein